MEIVRSRCGVFFCAVARVQHAIRRIRNDIDLMDYSPQPEPSNRISFPVTFTERPKVSAMTFAISSGSSLSNVTVSRQLAFFSLVVNLYGYTSFSVSITVRRSLSVKLKNLVL